MQLKLLTPVHSIFVRRLPAPVVVTWSIRLMLAVLLRLEISGIMLWNAIIIMKNLAHSCAQFDLIASFGGPLLRLA